MYLSTIGSTWFIIGWILNISYHLSYEIELHAEDTYSKYLKYEDRNDKDIERIMFDEKHHAQELKERYGDDQMTVLFVITFTMLLISAMELTWIE